MEINMERIVDLIRDRGIYAYVEQTGGGTATIYAGESRHEDGYGDRYAAAAGPGWFTGPGWTDARGDSTDFYIGPDDDGDAMPIMLDDITEVSLQDVDLEVLAASLVVLQATGIRDGNALTLDEIQAAGL